MAKGCGGIGTALSEYVAGMDNTVIPRARRVLIPGVTHATAAARHNLKVIE